MTGVAAPEPVAHCEVAGLDVHHVKVTERRYPQSTSDLVHVQLGPVALIGSLGRLQLVTAEVARQLVQIEQARR